MNGYVITVNYGQRRKDPDEGAFYAPTKAKAERLIERLRKKIPDYGWEMYEVASYYKGSVDDVIKEWMEEHMPEDIEYYDEMG